MDTTQTCHPYVVPRAAMGQSDVDDDGMTARGSGDARSVDLATSTEVTSADADATPAATGPDIANANGSPIEEAATGASSIPSASTTNVVQSRGRLSKADLGQRMCLKSDGLVEEIHSIAVRQNQLEDQRESRLDGKAQTLLGTAGLSLTVTFTFGGILLAHPEYLVPLGPWVARGVLALYVLALVLGLVASILAIAALLVRGGYRALSDDDVFNADVLELIDREARDAKSPKEHAQRLYRRRMVVQLWTIYRAHFDVHERKASIIKWGQAFFIGFLVALILIGAGITYTAFDSYLSTETPHVGLPRIEP